MRATQPCKVRSDKVYAHRHSSISMHATVDARVRYRRRGDVVDDYAWWCGAMSTVMRVMMLMMVMVRARVMAMLATVVTAIQ